eukprot:g16000.t1
MNSVVMLEQAKAKAAAALRPKTTSYFKAKGKATKGEKLCLKKDSCTDKECSEKLYEYKSVCCTADAKIKAVLDYAETFDALLSSQGPSGSFDALSCCGMLRKLELVRRFG